MRIDFLARVCYFCGNESYLRGQATHGLMPPTRQERLNHYDNCMETHLHRCSLLRAALPAGAAGVAVAAPGPQALSAGATGTLAFGVTFWKDQGSQTSLADSSVDRERTAALTRQTNGTYTLELPLKKLSKLNITGHLTGITIGDVNYDGEVSGSFHQKSPRLHPDRQ